ncbi:uncharacterized protein LOC127794989 [Diospyros lotus]|uniref:uncharacterized protein LOC127794989 n=1 Tax=Diospyros lotus TaxID=55363 RepID=UPI00225175F9|nr:uncharacterized protein LOC127794989 [Diospyros lotus]
MAAQAAATVSRVSPDAVERAVSALLKWRTAHSANQKPHLFDQDDDFVYLVLTQKKIPQKSRINAHKIPLPHALQDGASSELCLIIDDRPKSSKLTSDMAKKKIKSENIPIAKVLKLSKLKSDYKPFEAKRKLCDSYDMFFADKRVIPLLPKLLGKQFFKKKKIPVPVDLTHNNWKEQIERACSSALLYVAKGTCSVVRVAKPSMESGDIVENVVAAIDRIVEVIPKKWAGLRSLHLKFLESLALPIYQALPDAKLKIEGRNTDNGSDEGIKEASEGHGKLIQKKVASKKGRIHEVRYMDDEVGGQEDELATEDDDNEAEKIGNGDSMAEQVPSLKAEKKSRKLGGKAGEGEEGDKSEGKKVKKKKRGDEKLKDKKRSKKAKEQSGL